MKVFFFLIIGDFMKKQITLFFFPFYVPIIYQVAASVVQVQRAGLQHPSSRVQTRPKPSDFQGEKFLSTPSFGGEVKPSVPCRRFAACKRSLNLSGSWNLGKITGQFLAHNSTFLCQDVSRRSGRTGTWRRKLQRLKMGGKQWQITPKNLPRMQCARAIPVT